jgi:hypothetical protein
VINSEDTQAFLEQAAGQFRHSLLLKVFQHQRNAEKRQLDLLLERLRHMLLDQNRVDGNH